MVGKGVEAGKASITVSGGDKWRKALERLAQKVQVCAGVLENARYQGKCVAQYAAYNEFGGRPAHASISGHTGRNGFCGLRRPNMFF